MCWRWLISIKFLAFVLVFSCASILATSTVKANSWQRLSPQFGAGLVTCVEDAANYSCFALQCHAKRGLEFGFYTSTRGANTPGFATMRVDGGRTYVARLRDVGVPDQRVQNVDYFTFGPFLAELGAGRSLELRTDALVSLPIVGARQAIDYVLEQCKESPAARFADYQGLTQDYSVGARISAPKHTSLSYLAGTDSWGEDLDSGLTNPSLRGISDSACIARCLGRPDCKLTTYNTDRKVCFLKRAFGNLRADGAAHTTLIQERPTEIRLPALPGPHTLSETTHRASPLVPLDSYIAGRRSEAAAMGGACQAELADVQRVAGTIAVQEAPKEGLAGQPAYLAWTSQPLTQRVPAWVVISADRPVRFEGEGAYGLNAGALGPFGVEIDRDKQRAFAPLYTTHNLTGGRVGVIPLEAGAYNITVTLVAYLRACQQEVPIAQVVYTPNVAPAPPRIVLRDVTATYPFDRRIDVPEFERRIEFNETRFQIQFTADGSEILSREGKDLRLSPTKRFVSIHDDDIFEIIDIVDGESIARVEGQRLAFWNADSFFLTDRAPWGDMRFGATMLPRLLAETYRTTGSCCPNGGTGNLIVDLENNVIRPVAGAASLLREEDLGAGEKHSYSSIGGVSLVRSFEPVAWDGVDLVAPVYTDAKWSTPLGPIYVRNGIGELTHSGASAEDEAIAAMALLDTPSAPNPRFGQAFDQLAAAPVNVITRGASVAKNSDEGFMLAMTRIGVTLTPGLKPEPYLDTFLGGVEPQPLSEADQQATARTVAQIERDVAQAGKSVAWSKVDLSLDFFQRASCEHFPGSFSSQDPPIDNPTATPVDISSLSAHDLELALRFQLDARVIWISRAVCRGGTLGSNLVSSASLNIFDSQTDLPSHAAHRVDEFHTWGANFSRGIFERGFEAKLFFDRYVVTYATGAGALIVFDLTTRTFLMKIDYARRGDLLEDVFLDADARYLYQLNSNGSFTVYDIARASPVLEGRYLDDEIVIWTATFHFDSTEEGAAFVELRFPGEPGQYSFQQFETALHVPGLMEQVRAETISLPEIALSPPPRVEGRLEPEGDTIRGVLQITANSQVEAIRVFQDGVLTGTYPAKRDALTIFEAERLPGARWVSVVAQDAAGLVSLPLNLDLGDPKRTAPRTHFFGVGIDHYPSPALESLNYAKRDVLRVSKALGGEGAPGGTAAPLASQTILVDRRATRAEILDGLSETVAAASPGDHLVLFMAGHGLRDGDGAFYFALSHTDVNNLAETGLSWRRLADELSRLDIRVTILLDACHAGATGSGAFASNDGAVNALIDKTQANVTVIAAAKGRQFSGESPEVGGGFFSVAVAQTLLDRRAEFDRNGNGALEAVEFYRGVKSLVTARRGTKQTPWMVRNQLVGDYALF